MMTVNGSNRSRMVIQSDLDALLTKLGHRGIVKPIKGDEETKQIECPSHGVYLATLCNRRQLENKKLVPAVIPSTCPACASDLAALEDELAESINQERLASIRAQRMARTDIGEAYAECKLETYEPRCREQESALKACVDLIENMPTDKIGRGLILIGPPGTGKTHLAVGLARRAIEMDVDSLYTTAFRIFGKVRSTFDDSSCESAESVIAFYAGVGFLVVDEVGVQSGTDFERTTFYQIIDERLRRKRPTVIVSNLDIEHMTDVVGERTMDRFRATMSKVPVLGKSLRAEMKKKATMEMKANK